VTVGQASTNLASLKHDAIRLALTCRHGKPRVCLSIRDVGSRNGTYLNGEKIGALNGEKIGAERVLRCGDELRVGNSRLIFWEVKQADEASANEATVSVKTAQLPPRLTRRELRS
jgi:pSer/pThr/pTyr-binding forkhead associated (FHA) protein